MTLSQASLLGYPTVPTGFDEKTKSDPNHSHCLCEVEQITICSQVNHDLMGKPEGFFHAIPTCFESVPPHLSEGVYHTSFLKQLSMSTPDFLFTLLDQLEEIWWIFASNMFPTWKAQSTTNFWAAIPSLSDIFVAHSPFKVWFKSQNWPISGWCSGLRLSNGDFTDRTWVLYHQADLLLLMYLWFNRVQKPHRGCTKSCRALASQSGSGSEPSELWENGGINKYPVEWDFNAISPSLIIFFRGFDYQTSGDITIKLTNDGWVLTWVKKTASFKGFSDEGSRWEASPCPWDGECAG